MDIRFDPTHLFRHFYSCHFRHLHIAHHHIRQAILKYFQCLFGMVTIKNQEKLSEIFLEKLL